MPCEVGGCYATRGSAAEDGGEVEGSSGDGRRCVEGGSHCDLERRIMDREQRVFQFPDGDLGAVVADSRSMLGATLLRCIIAPKM